MNRTGLAGGNPVTNVLQAACHCAAAHPYAPIAKDEKQTLFILLPIPGPKHTCQNHNSIPLVPTFWEEHHDFHPTP